jgi:hypothetical protein
LKTSFPRWWFKLAIGSFVLIGGLLFLQRVFYNRTLIEPLPDSEVESRFELGGQPHVIAGGRAYRIERNSKWSLVADLYDPEFLNRSFVRDGKEIYRVAEDTGERYRIPDRVSEDFEGRSEGISGLKELILSRTGWSDLTLQTSRTPQVSDYVRLRKDILRNEGQFFDARVEPMEAAAHRGQQGLRFVCPQPTRGLICSKASLSFGLAHYGRGDTLHFQAWYRIVGPSRPHTIADFESRYVLQSPGLRLSLGEEGELEAELKTLNKVYYRQLGKPRKKFPTDTWVCVTAEIFLDPASGTVRIWQDDDLLIDAVGPTLAIPSAIIDSIEIGISAHSYPTGTVTLDMDDVIISREPISLP